MRRRALVAVSVVAPDFGRSITIGDMVDLSERLPQGGTLADLVRPEWFTDDAPAPTKRAKKEPASPAEE